MLFLIDYERQSGRIVAMDTYLESQRHEAEEARLVLELKLRNEGIEREIVLLEAADEVALRKTHRRYFENWEDLARVKTG